MGCWVGALSTLVGKIDPTLVTLEARGFRGHLNSKPDRFCRLPGGQYLSTDGRSKEGLGFCCEYKVLKFRVTFSTTASHVESRVYVRRHWA